MNDFFGYLKNVWLDMLEPPWRRPQSPAERRIHWVLWLAGWAWSLSGLVIGASIAPMFVQNWAFTNPSYRDALAIALAVAAGFLLQLLGWWLSTLVFAYLGFMTSFVQLATAAWLLAVAGYGVYHYFTLVSGSQ